jgi:hypothetical protein
VDLAERRTARPGRIEANTLTPAQEKMNTTDDEGTKTRQRGRFSRVVESSSDVVFTSFL